MSAKRALSVVGVLAILAIPSQASAGGWWNGLHLMGQTLGVGEKLSFDSDVIFRDIDSAKAAGSVGYLAYLVRGMDTKRLEEAMTRPEPKDWWSTPEQMIEIGTVSFSRRDANLAIATAHLDVPDVPSGSYNLMLCSPGCEEPVGNLIPLKIRVSSDAVAAKAVRRLTEKTWDLKIALAGTKRDLRQSERRFDLLKERAEEREDIAPVVRTAASTEAPKASTPWLPYAGSFVAGALLSTLVATGIRRRAGFR